MTTGPSRRGACGIWACVVLACGPAQEESCPDLCVEVREFVDVDDGWLGGVRAADFDGEERTDLVLEGTNGGGVEVRYGTNGLRVGDTVSDAADRASIGDLDRDGRPDIVVPETDANLFAVLFGVSDGAERVETPGPVDTVAVADFFGENTDALASIACDGTVACTATTWRSEGRSLVRVVESTLPGHTRPSVAVPGDFDGDGDADLAYGLGVGEEAVHVAFGDGSGSFGDPVAVPVGAEPEPGVLPFAGYDALVTSVRTAGGGLRVQVHTLEERAPRERFSWTIESETPAEIGVGLTTGVRPLAADVNEDGHLDLVLADKWIHAREGDYCVLTVLTVLLGAGDGGFEDPKTLTLNETCGDTQAVAGGLLMSSVLANLQDGSPGIVVGQPDYDTTASSVAGLLVVSVATGP